MKSNKSKLKLYYNLSLLSNISYILCSIIVLVPIFIVFITDIPFGDLFTRISLTTGYLFFILGKGSKILKNKLEHKDISIDLSILLGILFAFILYIFKIKVS